MTTVNKKMLHLCMWLAGICGTLCLLAYIPILLYSPPWGDKGIYMVDDEYMSIHNSFNMIHLTKDDYTPYLKSDGHCYPLHHNISREGNKLFDNEDFHIYTIHIEQRTLIVKLLTTEETEIVAHKTSSFYDVYTWLFWSEQPEFIQLP